MDDDRFDALAKTLATSTSRRPLIRLLAGGFVALVHFYCVRDGQFTAQCVPR